jgi:hypothetical protein
MSEFFNPDFRTARDRSFGALCKSLQERIDAIPVTLVTDISLLSPTSAQRAAEKECWQLFLNGIRHMKDGGPAGQPGLFTEALAKASFRASSLAQTTGVAPPKFEQVYFAVDYTNGHEEAVFFASQLVRAAMDDLKKSVSLLRQKMVEGNLSEEESLIRQSGDKDMLALFEAIKKTQGPATAENVFGKDLSLELRKQAFMSLQILEDVYAETCDRLAHDIKNLKPPAAPKPDHRPGPRG